MLVLMLNKSLPLLLWGGQPSTGDVLAGIDSPQAGLGKGRSQQWWGWSKEEEIGEAVGPCASHGNRMRSARGRSFKEWRDIFVPQAELSVGVSLCCRAPSQAGALRERVRSRDCVSSDSYQVWLLGDLDEKSGF